MTKAEYREKLESLLYASSFYEIDDSYHAEKDELPHSKIQNAIKSYASGASIDEVVAIADSTVFGSGKEGMLFTLDSLYIKLPYDNKIKGNYMTFSGYNDTDEDEYILVSPKKYKLPKGYICNYGFEVMLDKVKKLYKEYKDSEQEQNEKKKEINDILAMADEL